MAQNPPKDNVDELSVRLEKVHLDLIDESDDYVQVNIIWISV